MAEERKWGRMPRWPKPNIKRGGSQERPHWAVVFSDKRYPHVRYSTGHHASTVIEAWRHLPVMEKWHGVPPYGDSPGS